MTFRPLSLIAAGAGGLLVGVALMVSGPVAAQFKQPGGPSNPGAVLAPATAATQPATPQQVQMPQPIEIQTLDANRFVVVTREARLLQSASRPGTATNMVVTVVTQYTVADNQLVPIEHVRAPEGWRPVAFAAE